MTARQLKDLIDKLPEDKMDATVVIFQPGMGGLAPAKRLVTIPKDHVHGESIENLVLIDYGGHIVSKLGESEGYKVYHEDLLK
jgi:hypothetical protein